jgi:hypothetical protein
MNAEQNLQFRQRVVMIVMAIVVADFVLDSDDEIVLLLCNDREITDQIYEGLSESMMTRLVSTIISSAMDALIELENTRKRSVEEIVNNEGDEAAPQCRRSVSRWDWERARQAVWKDYVGPNPSFDDHQFERVFRITRPVMEELRTILGNLDDFFTENIV